MANETTEQTSCMEENDKADECRENIPPEVTAGAGASKLKVQDVGDNGIRYSYTQPGGGNEPLSDTYAFSTPAPTSSKTKSRLSGLQSALTPILKYLNIGNKSPSSDPLKQRNNPPPTVASDISRSHSSQSLGDTSARVCLLNEEITLLDVTCDNTMHDSALPDSIPDAPVTPGSVKHVLTSQHPSQLSPSASLNTTAQTLCSQRKTLDPPQSNARSVSAACKVTNQANVVTKNTTGTSFVMNDQSLGGNVGGLRAFEGATLDKHALQKRGRSSVLGEAGGETFCLQNYTLSDSHQFQVPLPPLSKYSGTAAFKDSESNMVDIPESIDAPMSWMDNRFFPEITLLDATHGSELNTECDISSLEVTQDISPVDGLPNNPPSPQLGGQLEVQPGTGTLDTIQSEDFSRTIGSFSEQPDKHASENVLKASLEVTRDISAGSILEDSRPSVEPSGQSGMKIETSAGDTSATHPANITQDLSSSSEQSGKDADENIPKASLEVTQDISMGSVLEDRRPSVEPSGQSVMKSQTSDKDTSATHPANITQDLSSSGDQSGKCADENMQKASLEVTRDVSMASVLEDSQPPSDPSGQSGSNIRPSAEDACVTHPANVTHDLTSSSEQLDQCVPENIPKASLEGTRDISMGSVLEDSRPLSEPSRQNTSKIQTPAESKAGGHPANVTRDMNASSDVSVQCATPQLPTAEVRCKSSSNNVTAELHDEPEVTSDTGKATAEEMQTSRDAVLSSDVSQPTSKTAGSVNSTFTTSGLSASTNANTTTQTVCPQNQTLDLPASNANSPKTESDQAASVSITKISPDIDQNCSAANNSASCNVQSVTFDGSSLPKISTSTVLGESGAATSCPQNTSGTKSPKQNGTITVSETSSSDSHLKAADKTSPVVSNISSPKDSKPEVLPPEPSKHNETATSTDPIANMAATPVNRCEVKPSAEVGSGADRRGTKDHSQSGLPMRDDLSDNFGHQSVDSEDNKANTFNLDDTLDLRADALITSTPMTNCKMFHTKPEEGKILAAQKKLYGDGPSKPDVQAPSDVPNNIVCDRKTFLTQPAAKSLFPLKTASQLLKFKSALPGRSEPLGSGLPMTRRRTQVEALKNTAAPQPNTGISNPYNLRPATTGSKQLGSGLRKPQLSGTQSGIQRPALSLRPPSARPPASSSNDKLCGTAATAQATQISQAKKHPLIRNEVLPVAKRTKFGAPLPSSNAEVSTSSCDAANKVKNLKRPTTSEVALPAKTQRDDAAVSASTAEISTSCSTASRARGLKQPITSHRALPPKPQGHGCDKCAMLVKQLELKSEEIRKLKEELLKYRKQEEEC